jgi:hypothetical protein
MTTLTRVRTLDATGKVLGTDLVNLDTALYVLNMRHHGSRDYRRICWPNQTYLDVRFPRPPADHGRAPHRA